jgi:hypothetical protein
VSKSKSLLSNGLPDIPVGGIREGGAYSQSSEHEDGDKCLENLPIPGASSESIHPDRREHNYTIDRSDLPPGFSS